MGGAERAERRRKQQAAQAAKESPQQAPAPGRVGRPVVAGVAVVALLALVVGVGLYLQNRNSATDLPVAVPPAAEGPQYAVRVDGDTIVAGDDDAPVTLEVYADFLCPACGEFEQEYGMRIERAVAAGDARMIYHPVAILDERSEPEGYSTLSAGAAFCAADAEVFPRFHRSLFATQPVEGSDAWTRPQLQQLGRDLGAGDDFVRCVRQAEDERIEQATDTARDRLSELRPDGQFGTPTVIVDGRQADTGDPTWLDEALRGGRG